MTDLVLVNKYHIHLLDIGISYPGITLLAVASSISLDFEPQEILLTSVLATIRRTRRVKTRGGGQRIGIGAVCCGSKA